MPLHHHPERPSRPSHLSRRAVLVAGALGLAAACTPDHGHPAAAGGAAASGSPSGAPEPMPTLASETGDVSAFPLPGSRYAPPGSEISLRGPVTATQAKAVTVHGSQSGAHDLAVHPHADGAGVSLVPAKPFTAGEQVTVTTGLAVRGANGGAVTFTVADVVATVVGPDNEGVDPSQVQQFETEPALAVPKITVTTDQGAAAGRVFLTSYRGPGIDGPLLLDDHGGLLWARAAPDGLRAANFQAQTWRGRPVLTWWQGQISKIGDSVGSAYLFNDRYQQIGQVDGGNGLAVDLHEFTITAQGTALVLCYLHCRTDLSAHGGPTDGVVIDGVIQELEIETGRVLFEWHALDHIDLAESYQAESKDPDVAFDAYHLNSVQKAADGSYLLSSRATHTVYRIDGETGQIRWRLGGRKGNFTLGPGAAFSSQHDARWVDPHTISLFNNNSGVGAATGQNSVALVLRIDESAQTATVVTSRNRGPKALSASQGSTQVLPNGHLFVGWGAQPNVTEYDADGTVVFAAALPSADQSYRAFRLPWTGHPTDPPAVVARVAGKGHVVSVSWNGATEVASWRIRTGPTRSRQQALKSLPRNGFETSATIAGLGAWLTAEALDAAGRVLGRSTPLPVPTTAA